MRKQHAIEKVKANVACVLRRHCLIIILKGLLIKFDFHLTRLKLLFSMFISKEEKNLLRKVSLKIHRNDNMYGCFKARDYIFTGLSAVQCIENALQKSGDNNVRTILDFPSGYGRILRFLRVRFPHAQITASEIDNVALDFCRKAFNVKSFLSNKCFNKVLLGGSFSLIWCGSLFTHIDEDEAVNLLKLFYRYLSPGGLCVFTTNGRYWAERIESGYKYARHSSAISRKTMVSEFYENGYGYADCENQSGYGISVVPHDRMVALASSVGHWKECFFLENGWINWQDFQDVYGFTKPMPNKVV